MSGESLRVLAAVACWPPLDLTLALTLSLTPRVRCAQPLRLPPEQERQQRRAFDANAAAARAQYDARAAAFQRINSEEAERFKREKRERGEAKRAGREEASLQRSVAANRAAAVRSS
jgi:hypothetical protein